MLGGPQLGFADALFESVSGFTTTGATVIQDLDAWPHDLLLWRALSQWLGGLGILVLFMLFLSSLGAGSKFLFKSETGFQHNDFAAVKIRDVAFMILKLYLIMTGICALGLRVIGMDWFEAITHAFTTISTAGFSIYDESIGYFREWETAWLIESWITLFMILPSLSFIMYIIAWHRLRGATRKFEKNRKIEEIPIYLCFLALIWLLMTRADAACIPEDGVFTWLRRALFTVVSLSTTTGYGVLPERSWPTYCVPLLTLLMLVGGCIGSTAGGMKVYRFIVLARALRQNIVKAFRPHEYSRVRVNEKIVKEDVLYQTILYIAAFLCILFLSTLIVALLEEGNGIDLETAYGAAIGTLCNVGPGFGEVGLWGNFGSLSAGTKFFLSFLMVLGRLEIFALLALLSPKTWKRF